MLPPQSDDEIRRIVELIQRLDSRLNIRWNPRARVLTPHTYDAYGLPRPEIIDGRWEVIIHLGDGQPPAVVYRVEWDGDRDGEYRPVGEWLVEFLNKWDSQQAHYREAADQAWREHDLVAANASQLDRAGAQEFMDAQHFELAGSYWIGRGAEFTR